LVLSTPNFLVRFLAWSLTAWCTQLTGVSKDELGLGLEEVVITIGEHKLTSSEVDRIFRLLPPRQRSFFSKQAGRHQFAEYIVRARLYSWEAEKLGLNNRTDVQEAIQKFKGHLEKNQLKGIVINDAEDKEQVLRIFKESFLAQLAEKELKKEIQVSSQELADYLRQNSALFDMVRGRRIVIRSASSNHLYGDNRPSDQVLSDDEAKDSAENIRSKIEEGADFEVMAAKYSDDILTLGVGGDMGIVRRGVPNKNLVTPPVVDLLFSMKVGELSPVVETPWGFSILKLEEKRKLNLKEVKTEIEVRIRNQKLETLYQKIRVEHDVKINSLFFRAPANPIGALPQP